MPEQNQPVVIDYYTDILCVWAWIAQPRLDEVHRQWGETILVRQRFVDHLGDCYRKIPPQWGQQEGFETYGKHVVEAAAGHESATVNPGLWSQVRPLSSLPSHLALKAAELSAGGDAAAELALHIRRAFFCDAQDVAQRSVLLSIANEAAIDTAALQVQLENGAAAAALSADLRAANDAGVRGSPTWILNDGRQVLYGNVGYRILHANIEELMSRPIQEASWC